MGKARSGLRVAAVAAAGALALAACGGGGGSTGGGGGGGGANAGANSPQKGGTLTFLTQSQQIQHLDPQRNYTGEDLAFSSAYLTRTLTAYVYTTDDKKANTIQGDLATDIGKPSDGAKTWTFTLRDGAKWEDGTDVTCNDLKYGISRTFAQTVITDGPTYAIDLLDIPKDADGNSTYKGPYETSKNDTAAFDKAVACSSDGKTITFHLSRPAPDFNYTTTLTAFAAVPKAKDTGEKYDDKIVSNGPYKVTQYTKGQQLVLDRNPNWSATTDTYRPAYPDKIVMKFGVATSTIDQRMQANAGADQQAISRDALDTASLTTVFNDPRFANRRVNAYSAYTRYIAINVTKVPNLKHRQAILAAADRKQIQTVNGGSFAGDLADGFIKPNLTTDYAPTGLWTNLLGKQIPDNGDPAYAKQLIAQSGKPMPKITYDYAKTDLGDQQAAALQSSLARAGIKVTLNPLERGAYYGIVLDKTKQHEMSASGWGPDWPNASTVVPPLTTPLGGFDLSHGADKAYLAKIEAAKIETDRAKQAKMWQDLNKYAMQQAWALPTLFERDQRLAGSKVGSKTGNGKMYDWAPYTSWPYADMYVQK
jgi:peptide/nickel transport system substrate-binding protein